MTTDREQQGEAKLPFDKKQRNAAARRAAAARAAAEAAAGEMMALRDGRTVAARPLARGEVAGIAPAGLALLCGGGAARRMDRALGAGAPVEVNIEDRAHVRVFDPGADSAGAFAWLVECVYRTPDFMAAMPAEFRAECEAKPLLAAIAAGDAEGEPAPAAVRDGSVARGVAVEYAGRMAARGRMAVTTALAGMHWGYATYLSPLFDGLASSCAPNMLACADAAGVLYLQPVRDIAPGERLTIAPRAEMLGFAKAARVLRLRSGGEAAGCGCPRCVEGDTPAERAAPPIDWRRFLGVDAQPGHPGGGGANVLADFAAKLRGAMPVDPAERARAATAAQIVLRAARQRAAQIEALRARAAAAAAKRQKKSVRAAKKKARARGGRARGGGDENDPELEAAAAETALQRQLDGFDLDSFTAVRMGALVAVQYLRHRVDTMVRDADFDDLEDARADVAAYLGYLDSLLAGAPADLPAAADTLKHDRAWFGLLMLMSDLAFTDTAAERPLSAGERAFLRCCRGDLPFAAELQLPLSELADAE